jgi:hypothetical protein
LVVCKSGRQAKTIAPKTLLLLPKIREHPALNLRTKLGSLARIPAPRNVNLFSNDKPRPRAGTTGAKALLFPAKISLEYCRIFSTRIRILTLDLEPLQPIQCSEHIYASQPKTIIHTPLLSLSKIRITSCLLPCRVSEFLAERKRRTGAPTERSREFRQVTSASPEVAQSSNTRRTQVAHKSHRVIG